MITVTVKEIDVKAFNAAVEACGCELDGSYLQSFCGPDYNRTYRVITPSPEALAAFTATKWAVEAAERADQEFLARSLAESARLEKALADMAAKRQRGFWTNLFGAAR